MADPLVAAVDRLVEAMREQTRALDDYTASNAALIQILLAPDPDDADAEPARYLDGSPMEPH